ncbi:multidrug/spermidine efflux SMR transporter subunit MdtI [Comamonas endophytica]|uniref:Spermidine export protein MdtI n=1 Tax=Comamonas endophytica TaxID=2949090 RepID=A0ABY6GFG1_9BURK|nr:MULTISPECIES: multidrug/spermidine efflux SMR transporter subunit MdtI [unclassified Acidovorax]MCD2513385.1 multidrug/spermidine efflux SMR transporter subunit MdtI [Acidovorax sp. D4N7]UYG53832.1 multidrug/spermidine efflux SMR transporter subunit MdtI [Acidovorax sp. 5MLIR]
MQNAQFIHYAFMGLAVLLEVAANVFIKCSAGWRRKVWGVLGIGCVLASFTALSQAVKGIDLSVAYALWGGTGIVLTTAAGRLFFQQALARRGWAGIALIVLGVLLLKLS